mmetsp:Transcript_11119/g.16328  ORF Transcript_11119/g.16328 Transcript_11119/m.16328 type:complete len:948 (+) Transcript_11119:156-2999(+)
MTILFERPVGAKADVAELEYVSALLQTNRNSLRADGSLIARDVHLYLKSRYGIEFSEEDVKDFIMQELAGTLISNENSEEKAPMDNSIDSSIDSAGKEAPKKKDVTEEDEPKIDLVQLTSLILIPVIRAQCRRSFLTKMPLFTGELGSLAKSNSEEDEVDFHDCIDQSKEISMQNNAQSNIEEQDSDVIDLVITIILQEAGLERNVELTEENMRKILIVFREQWPDEVVQGMINVCGDNPVFNRDTFLHALTNDTKAYDLSRNHKYSSHYEDACNAAHDGGNYHRLKRFYTAPNVDSAVDTYGSRLWTILAFFTYFVTAFVYLFNTLNVKGSDFLVLDCQGIETVKTALFFGCTVVNSIIALVRIFFLFAVLGFLMLFFTTLGNSVYIYGSYRDKFGYKSDRKLAKRMLSLGKKTTVFCMAIAVNIFFVYILFFFPIDTVIIDTTTKYYKTNLKYVSLVLGTLLFFTQLVQFFRIIIPQKYYENFTKGSWMISGTINAEMKLKQAGIFKLDKMIKNAIDCHYDDNLYITDNTICNNAIASIDSLEYYQSAVSDALLRYTMKENRKEIAGGIKWTFKKLRDGTLFTEEGLWLFPRLVTANFVQWLVALAFLFALFALQNLITGFLESKIPNESDSIRIASVVGCIPAVLSATNVALTYIPSAFATILKYRSGFWPCLKDYRWLQHRYAVDTVNIMFGAAIYATLFSGLISFALTAGVTYTIVTTNETVRQIADDIYPVLLGILLHLFIIFLLLYLFRKNMYRGFMRRRPAITNILNTFNEGWMTGIAFYMIPLRFVLLLCATFFYLGRLDTPFLAPGIGWLLNKFPMDALPITFRRDLFLHEAHRHPYIERLGYLYLLKIGRREDFGTREGAAWRILFTLALCPWLGKYRLNCFRQTESRTPERGFEMSSIQTCQSQVIELEKELVASKRMLVEKIMSQRTINKDLIK